MVFRSSLQRPLLAPSLHGPQEKRAKHIQSSIIFAVLHWDRTDSETSGWKTSCPATKRAGSLPFPQRSLGFSHMDVRSPGLTRATCKVCQESLVVPGLSKWRFCRGRKGLTPFPSPLLPGSQQQRPQRFPFLTHLGMLLPMTASSQIYQTCFDDAQPKKGPQGGIVYVPGSPLGSVARLKHLHSV